MLSVPEKHGAFSSTELNNKKAAFLGVGAAGAVGGARGLDKGGPKGSVEGEGIGREGS